MNAYYNVTQKIKDLLLEDEDINTVTKGKDVDIEKKNIFPLAHLNVIDAGFTSTTIDFNVAVFAMDLRNHSNKPTTDKFKGNDNEDDNLNSMLYVLLRLYLKLLKLGDVYMLTNVQRPEPFTEARMNVVDGWVMRFTIEVPIDEAVC